MPGQNYGLQKGFLLDTGATMANVQFGRVAVLLTNTSVTTAGANAAAPLGLFTDSVRGGVDTTKAATGKVTVGVAMEGLHRGEAGAAITRWARLTTDASGRLVAKTQTAAGSQPVPVVGIALTPASSAGDQIDVWLTPGATY
jgi:hypothetical protein